MTKEEQLEQSVIAFVLQQSEDFQLQDILDRLDPALLGKGKIAKKSITDILTFNGLTFSKGAEPSKQFTPRHSYFQNARFMVSPKTEEVVQGILIPGHRCIPFFNPSLHPWDCTLVTQEGIEAPRKILSRPFGSLPIYYNLFGTENLGNLLVLDQPSNAKILSVNGITDKTQVSITVFDFADLYRQWNFTAGDGIICEVKDWVKGVYAIRHIPQEKRQELMDHSMEWIAKLEQGFQRVFDTFSIKMDIEEQVAYAYYYAGREILPDPPMHLGGFLDISDKVYLVPFGIETKLWHEKEFSLSQVFADIDLVPKKKGFAGLLENLNAPCSEIEVEAFAWDEVFRYRGIVTEDQEVQYFDSIIKRIFGNRTRFFTQDQDRELFKYFQKLWKRIAKSYNYFKDQIPGKARHTLLEILEDYYEWFRNLSDMAINPEELPVQLLTSIGQLYSTLTNYLVILNQYDIEDQPQVNQLMEFLPTINNTMESMKQSVLEHIKGGRNPSEHTNLRLVHPSDEEKEAPKGSEEPERIFVFRISLKDIRPQIWRSVQVPGSFTLGDFHEVIQTALGWHNAHLHEFRIDNIYYGPVMEDNFSNFSMDFEDEDAYTLDMLGLAEKQRFLYTYDFGDYWEHQILVSKIYPAEDFSETAKQTSCCLKGKRACPPEDCGGPFGYGEVLEALAAPQKKKYRELAEWVGDFDPEYFDLETVNRRFRGDI